MRPPSSLLCHRQRGRKGPAALFLPALLGLRPTRNRGAVGRADARSGDNLARRSRQQVVLGRQIASSGRATKGRIREGPQLSPGLGAGKGVRSPMACAGPAAPLPGAAALGGSRPAGTELRFHRKGKERRNIVGIKLDLQTLSPSPALFCSPGLVLWDCTLVGKVAAPARAWSPLAPGLPAWVEQPHSCCFLTMYEIQSQFM
ncbi:uncharacterized protein LOC141949385 [Strix uralensis]|uniref:uncharacterized protein LOC141949385 n=1 Tax=Strix uralensis TaxID=36305 RepID=UPI003DA261A6